MNEIFKQIIAEFQESKLPITYQRNYKLPQTQEIVALIGLRRVGKTYLLYQEIKKYPKEQCIYVNFEDERLATLQPTDLQLIFDAYYELFPHNLDKELYLFFDEIQEAPQWQKFLTRLYEQKKYRIFVTGSSAKLLSQEIATQLRGRVHSIFVHPLSFSEFLSFKGIQITQQDMYSQKKAVIKKEFLEFLEYGGYPRVAQTKELLEKTQLLSTYLELVIYRDLVDRHAIKNLEGIQALIRFFITNTAKLASLNSFYTSIKGSILISKDTISEYFSYLLDIRFFSQLYVYNSSLKKQNLAQKKVYLLETGFKKVYGFTISKDSGRILENIVFIQLKRMNKEIYYHKDKHECDFLTKEGNRITQAIQVCYDLNDENEKRELKGLVEACKSHKLKKGLLLTYDQEDTFTKDGIKIEVKPVWKWLLSATQ